MSDQAFDRRLTPARPDLAAAYLKGQVQAARFVEGERRRIREPVVSLRPEPRPDVGIDTELLRGAAFTVYDSDSEGWSWGQAEADGYVGWLPTDALAPWQEPTHAITTLRTFVYPGASMKLPASAALPFGARVTVSAQQDTFAAVGDGFVWAAHLVPCSVAEHEWVGIAERFERIPYLWGGKSSLGLDCSGLVQTALHAAGISCPRDTDMQEKALGTAVNPNGPLQRGDLVFWKGHVGIMRDAATLLHANGSSMTVLSEPFAEARSRILAATGGDVTSVRRIG